MLVLRRKAGEAIVLNGVITIHVLAVEGERVKLGISAPPEVVIVRSELLENQGPMPGSPATSGSYWSNREAPRSPRDSGVNRQPGRDHRPGTPDSRNDPDGRDTGPAESKPDHVQPGRPVPAPLVSGPTHDNS
jgi:carbon storage regulator